MVIYVYGTSHLWGFQTVVFQAQFEGLMEWFYWSYRWVESGIWWPFNRSQCTVTVSQNSCNLELVYALGIFGVIPCVLKNIKQIIWSHLITSGLGKLLRDHKKSMKQQKGSSNHPLDPRIHLPSDPWDTPRLHPKDRKRWARGARSIFRPLDHRQITTHINEEISRIQQMEVC